jgi:hypothetical protein
MLHAPTIVIDPGHGGTRPSGRSSPFGGVGPAGTLEKTVTLEVARRVVARLGGRAVLTRDDDRGLSLAARAELARRVGASAFVSLHADHGSPGARGAEAWVHERATAASLALAGAIHRELGQVGPAAGVYRGPLAVLAPDHHAAGTAACLIELDKVADPDGERRLRDPAALDGLARAIARGIEAPRPGYGDATQFDFWAAWCDTERAIIGAIWFRPEPAAEEARRHMENAPLHSCRAVQFFMGQNASPGGAVPLSAYGGVIRRDGFWLSGSEQLRAFEVYIPPGQPPARLRIAATVETNNVPQPFTLRFQLRGDYGETITDAVQTSTMPARAPHAGCDVYWSGLRRDAPYMLSISITDTSTPMFSGEFEASVD